ncbi:hypothetical protein D3C81_1876990 [compost metagenome]
MSCRLQGPGDVPGLVVHRDDDADAVHALTSVDGASSAFVRSTLVNASMIHRYLWFGALRNIRNNVNDRKLMPRWVIRSA